MRKALLLFVITALSTALITPVFAAGKRTTAAKDVKQTSDNLGAYHAILIGINGYESFNGLKTPVKDVEDLAEVLKNEYGFEDVTLLTDKTADKPTASNILRTIRD